MSGPSTPAGPLRAFVDELIGAGLRDVVVCPGSRSTPLALALRAHPAMRVVMHLDERAAGFVALGMAKALRRPVALLATSGTAVVNFAPAVAEAHEGRVPLVVLTADRPPELRDRGANQTLDQAHLYGTHAKWYVELPVPEPGPTAEAHARWVAARLVATAAAAPAGPVQVNWPFRDPLVPDGSLVPDEPATPHTRVVAATVRLPEPTAVEALAARLAAAERPLVVCGPFDEPGFGPAIAALAAAGDLPVLADGLANLRSGPHDRSHVVARPDGVLRSGPFRAAHGPDVVVRFGATPTSKALSTYLAETAADQIVVDEGWNEPFLLAGTLIRADPGGVAWQLAEALRDATPRRDPGDARQRWLDAWLTAGSAADAAIRDALAGFDEPFEGAVFAELEGCLPAGTLLYAGNSMPVRDLDAFLAGGDTPLRCLANRGASGIDGVVSSALGAAAAGVGPVVAVVGDVSFVHDLNALVAARLHALDATIVVVDNDGGGIFSFLSQAVTDRPEVGLPDHYEELFGTPHGVDVLAVAAALGAETGDLEPGRIGPAIAASLDRPGVRVLRLRTERQRNVDLHRAVTAAVERALERWAVPAGRLP